MNILEYASVTYLVGSERDERSSTSGPNTPGNSDRERKGTKQHACPRVQSTGEHSRLVPGQGGTFVD